MLFKVELVALHAEEAGGVAAGFLQRLSEPLLTFDVNEDASQIVLERSEQWQWGRMDIGLPLSRGLRRGRRRAGATAPVWANYFIAPCTTAL